MEKASSLQSSRILQFIDDLCVNPFALSLDSGSLR